jgi:hypothetical protein
MQKEHTGSTDLPARHELEWLPPSPAVRVAPARQGQLAEMAAIAQREIPGVNASIAGLDFALREDPESIFAFERNGRLQGGIAFLYLNCRGQDALLLDDMDLRNPDPQYLARAGEEVAAIYVWALAFHGRSVVGLGNVAAYLRKPRFAHADYYAVPSSREGRDLLIALGFAQIPSFQAELWSYERPWNRLPRIVPPAARSFAHAWQ